MKARVRLANWNVRSSKSNRFEFSSSDSESVRERSIWYTELRTPEAFASRVLSRAGAFARLGGQAVLATFCRNCFPPLPGDGLRRGERASSFGFRVFRPRAGLLQVVNLNQANAGAAVLSGQDGREGAARERDIDACVERVSRRKGRRVAAIVIESQQNAVAVT